MNIYFKKMNYQFMLCSSLFFCTNKGKRCVWGGVEWGRDIKCDLGLHTHAHTRIHAYTVYI